MIHDSPVLIVFGAYKVCYMHKALCLGHEPKPNKAEGKRPAASEQANAAKRRIAAKAAKGSSFAF